MGYAYFDEHGIMHVVDKKEYAKEYAKLSGKIKVYDGAIRGGYPLFEDDEVIIRYEGGKFSAVLVSKEKGKKLGRREEEDFIGYARGLV